MQRESRRRLWNGSKGTVLNRKRRANDEYVSADEGAERRINFGGQGNENISNDRRRGRAE